MVYINKPSLHNLYFKPKPSYKSLENRDKDMKLFGLFKLQLETINTHISLTTPCNINPNQCNQTCRIENQEKLSAIIVIQIVTKTLILLHRICIHPRMSKPKSFLKTVFRDQYFSISQRHGIPLLMASLIISINKEIYYVTNMVHLDIPLLNVTSIRHYPELSLVIRGICINARLPTVNSTFLFSLKLITVKSPLKNINVLVIIPALHSRIL